MKITNLNQEVAELIEQSDGTFELAFGEISKGSPSQLKLQVDSEKGFAELKSSVSCGGCTKASHKKLSQNLYNVSISYDTNLLGRINKFVYIYYILKGEKESQKKIIKLTGKIMPNDN